LATEGMTDWADIFHSILLVPYKWFILATVV